MTAPATDATFSAWAPTRAPAAIGAAVIAAFGCAVLAARPALVSSVREPARLLVVMFVALLAAGLAVPLRDHFSASRSARSFATVTVLGVVGFAAGRFLIGGYAPARLTSYALAVNVLAAVAEEVWFRRLCYGLLESAGTAFAIAGSSVLFAAVHVSMYGWSILPLDLAAGALLGWQRAATGSWHAPALTHALANVFVLL
jgi:membrane protease YdiL (CAAX protease family)